MRRRDEPAMVEAGDGADLVGGAVGAVTAAVRSGRVGAVVAARVVAVVDADHGRLELRAAQLLAACAGWLGGRFDQVTAFGGAARGQVAVLAQADGGGTALVAAGARGLGEPMLGIAAWGSRGALSFQERGPAGDRVGSSPGAAPLAALIAESLRSGRTVHMVGGRAEVRPPIGLAAGVAVPAPPASPPAGRPIRALSPPYGVLLVAGDGTHQDYFGPSFAADPRCRVVGLADEATIAPRRREQNEALARRMGIPVLPDLDEALRRPDVQVVSNAAEPSRAGPISERAARAGKHLYLENLIAGTAEGACRVAAAVRSAGVVGQCWGIANATLADRMRAAIRGGILGDLAAVHQDYIFARAATYPFGGGAGGPAELGRPRVESATPRFDWLDGARREFASVGSYALVRLLSLVGRRARRVRATTGNYIYGHHQAADVEDFGQLLLEFDGGLVATLSAGLVGAAWHPSGDFDVATLVGTRAPLVVDESRPRVEVWAGDGFDRPGLPATSWHFPATGRANDDIGRFLGAIAAGRDAEGPASRAAEVLEILVAAYRSAATGEVVDLPPPTS